MCLVARYKISRLNCFAVPLTAQSPPSPPPSPPPPPAFSPPPAPPAPPAPPPPPPSPPMSGYAFTVPAITQPISINGARLFTSALPFSGRLVLNRLRQATHITPCFVRSPPLTKGGRHVPLR